MKALQILLFLFTCISTANAESIFVTDKFANTLKVHFNLGSNDYGDFRKTSNGFLIELDHLLLNFLSLNASVNMTGLSISNHETTQTNSIVYDGGIGTNNYYSAGAALRKKHLGYVLFDEATEMEISIIGNAVINKYTSFYEGSYDFQENTDVRLGAQFLGKIKMTYNYDKTNLLGFYEFDLGMLNYLDGEQLIQGSFEFSGPMSSSRDGRFLYSIGMDINKSSPGFNMLIGLGYRL